jgi:quercetin dioxygenase-like cupin family protein
MDSGTSLSWPLKSESTISCADWFNSGGTEFPLHSHDQREWVIVYEGKMLLIVGDGLEREIGVGESVVIEPRIEHKARFLEDTWYLAITIPMSPDWPR